MTVLLPNTRLGVRRSIEGAQDAYGYRPRAGLADLTAVGDGHAEEQADGRWRLRVPPGCWPVREGDVIAEPGGRSWTVVTADLLRHSIDPSVDYVRVEAFERRDGGTETPDSPTPPGG